MLHSCSSRDEQCRNARQAWNRRFAHVAGPGGIGATRRNAARERCAGTLRGTLRENAASSKRSATGGRARRPRRGRARRVRRPIAPTSATGASGRCRASTTAKIAAPGMPAARWLQRLAAVNPFSHVVEGARAALRGDLGDAQLLVGLVASALLAVLGLAVATRRGRFSASRPGPNVCANTCNKAWQYELPARSRRPGGRGRADLCFPAEGRSASQHGRTRARSSTELRDESRAEVASQCTPPHAAS